MASERMGVGNLTVVAHLRLEEARDEGTVFCQELLVGGGREVGRAPRVCPWLASEVPAGASLGWTHPQ